MEQLTSSKLGKEYDKAVYCHAANLTSVKCTSCEMLGLMQHQLESRLLRNMSNLRYAHDSALTADSEVGPKRLLLMLKEESEKAGCKLSIQKLRSWHPVLSLYVKQKGKKWKQ